MRITQAMTHQILFFLIFNKALKSKVFIEHNNKILSIIQNKEISFIDNDSFFCRIREYFQTHNQKELFIIRHEEVKHNNLAQQNVIIKALNFY
jgi:hypothetical protein